MLITKERKNIGKFFYLAIFLFLLLLTQIIAISFFVYSGMRMNNDLERFNAAMSEMLSRQALLNEKINVLSANVVKLQSEFYRFGAANND